MEPVHCNETAKVLLSVGSGLHTVDRIHDLAVRSSAAALLNFGVVDLKQVVDPCNELCPRLSHGLKTRRKLVVVECEMDDKDQLARGPVAVPGLVIRGT